MQASRHPMQASRHSLRRRRLSVLTQSKHGHRHAPAQPSPTLSCALVITMQQTALQPLHCLQNPASPPEAHVI